MKPSNTYTATCWREGSSWVVHIPEIDRTTRTARLSQVEGVARDLVSRLGHGEAATSRVVVNLLVHDGLMDLLDAAAAARQDRDRVSVEAVTLRRGLARGLAAEGFAVRDVAGLLGLSIVRAQQLIGEGSAPVPMPTKPVTSGQSAGRGGQSAGRGGHSAGRTGHSAGRRSPQVTTVKPVRPHRSYEHEAFFYRGDEDFLAGTVPFVLEGISLHQPVIVGATPRRLEQLQAAVGPEAPGVHFVKAAEVGANPARIIPALRAFVEAFGGPGHPVRGVGEPIWPGRRATEIAECQLHEALLNLSVEPDTPFWLRCLYDADAHGGRVIEEASRSHPSLREVGHYRGSTSYGGAHHAEALFGAPLPEPPEATAVSFGQTDVAAVRRLVGEHAARAGLPSDRIADLCLAVAEVTANSVRYGGGQGTLRTWRHGDALVFEVADAGHITDPLAGRRPPSEQTEGGRGLWLANQLCDLVQVRSGPNGTAVRLLSWLQRQSA